MGLNMCRSTAVASWQTLAVNTMTGMACASEAMDGDARHAQRDEQEQIMALEALTRQAPETLRGLRTTHEANWLRCLQDRQDRDQAVKHGTQHGKYPEANPPQGGDTIVDGPSRKPKASESVGQTTNDYPPSTWRSF